MRERRPELTYEDVLRIVELVKTARFSEFRLKVGEIEVHLRRPDGALHTPAKSAAAPAAGPEPAPASAAAEAVVSAARGTTERSFPEGTALVRAPMVGTFYRAPEPDAPPFVEVGSRVEPDTMVGIIEVMKLMNSITAGVRGVILEILAANGQHVSAGEPLMAVRPDPEDG